MTKPREFWIKTQGHKYKYYAYDENAEIGCTHVIEKSAVEAKDCEIDKLKKELAWLNKHCDAGWDTCEKRRIESEKLVEVLETTYMQMADCAYRKIEPTQDMFQRIKQALKEHRGEK